MAAARAQRTQGSGGSRGEGAPAAFRKAVAALEEAVCRPELRLDPLPAPRRLAPYAYALHASVEYGGEEAADGRFVLLHDPAGQDAWQGTFRVVTLGRTDLEPEMATDPLLPEVTWTWLTGALAAHEVAYAEPAGTVTHSGSSFFGTMAGRAPHSELEVRASWTPLGSGGGPDGTPDMAAHLAAWCDLLCQCAGLPPGDADGASVVPLPQRRGPQPS